MGDISKYINEEKKELMETKLTPQKICQLVELIESGEISNKIAKTLLPFLAKTDSSPKELVKEKGLTQLSDTKMITDWCQQVVDANPAEVQKYKSGKDKVFIFFVKAEVQPSILEDNFFVSSFNSLYFIILIVREIYSSLVED